MFRNNCNCYNKINTLVIIIILALRHIISYLIIIIFILEDHGEKYTPWKQSRK